MQSKLGIYFTKSLCKGSLGHLNCLTCQNNIFQLFLILFKSWLDHNALFLNMAAACHKGLRHGYKARLHGYEYILRQTLRKVRFQNGHYMATNSHKVSICVTKNYSRET